VLAKEILAKAVAGALVAGAALASSATAAADPPPPDIPVDPAAPAPPSANGIPPLSDLTSPLAQNGAGPAGLAGGLPENPLQGTLTGNHDSEYFLAQNPVPEAPGGDPGGTPPNLSAFNNAWLLPQNLVPSAPGAGQVYDVPPGEENANVGPLDPFRRMHHMNTDGLLKGGLLGQMPKEQLGEPLPGTAPPPGTATPPGLVQFLPDPAPVDPPPPPAG
jgi:hypothetical protein